VRRPIGTAEIFLSSWQIRCIAHFVMFVCRPNGTTGIFPVCSSVTVLHTLLRCTFGRGFLYPRLVVHVFRRNLGLAELMFPPLKKPICEKRLGVPIGASRRFCVVMIGRGYVAAMIVFMLFGLTSTANGFRRRQGGVWIVRSSDCRRQALLRKAICRFGSGVPSIYDLCQRDQRAQAADLLQPSLAVVSAAVIPDRSVYSHAASVLTRTISQKRQTIHCSP